MLANWGHLIALESTYQTSTARLQFFIGPGLIPRTWVVTLGGNPMRIYHAVFEGYFCRYFDAPAADGHDGEMVPLRTARLVRLR